MAAIAWLALPGGVLKPPSATKDRAVTLLKKIGQDRMAPGLSHRREDSGTGPHTGTQAGLTARKWLIHAESSATAGGLENR